MPPYRFSQRPAHGVIARPRPSGAPGAAQRPAVGGSLVTGGSARPSAPAPIEPSIRVMLVDDSAVVRRALEDVIRKERGLEVVGTAANGEEALARLAPFRPHVVVLDVEMPVLDGLGTLRKLRARYPDLPVIMFSTLTERGAAATLDALALGANDYVTKPTQSNSLGDSLDAIRSSLIPLVRSWGAIGRSKAERAKRSEDAGTNPAGSLRAMLQPATDASSEANVVLRRPPMRRPPVEAVVIGSSTGGPNALAEVVPALPADLRVPIVLVQHMPETFTRLLAERLDQQSAISVVEALPGMVLAGGTLYLAKGGVHLTVVRTATGAPALAYDNGPPENSCRPSVDVLFRSAVKVFGAGLLGVVLTGMGQDGLIGAAAIDAAGGAVLTQDEESSVVWGMPGAVARAGLSSEDLPLSAVAPAIVRRVGAQAKLGAA